MRAIASKCPNLRSFTYKLESFGAAYYNRVFDGLSDDGILALVRGCRKLESLELINARRVKAACFETIRDTVAADENAYALRSIKVTVSSTLIFESAPDYDTCSHIAHSSPQGRNFTVTGYPFVVEDVPGAPADPPTPMGGAAIFNPAFLMNMMFGVPLGEIEYFDPEGDD